MLQRQHHRADRHGAAAARLGHFVGDHAAQARRAAPRARATPIASRKSFWSGGDLTAMFRAIDQSRRVTKGMESIFESGFREFSRLRQQGGVAAAQLIEGSRRGMRVALLKESDRLEQGLSMLATVGSTSPYVGLFGTVWGIMNAFHGLGNVQQATLAMVAPGIAEALIATAMGLFAAIPGGHRLQPLRRPGEPHRAALRHVRRRAVDDPAASRFHAAQRSAAAAEARA